MSAMVQDDSAAGGTVLFITGMTCTGCVSAVGRALSRVPGVTGVEVDLASGRVCVGGTASPASLVAAVEKAGYGLRPGAA